MAKTPLHEQQAQAYLRLARRQLAMAQALLDENTLARTRAMVVKIEALLT